MPRRITRTSRPRVDRWVSAILLAAGEGRRLRLGLPKGALKLGGTPLVMRSLRAFESVRGVCEVILVLHPALRSLVERQLRDRPPSRPCRLVTGGRTRQDSVRRGLGAVAPRAQFVLTHDVARPFVRRPTVERVLAAAYRHRAAALAARPSDTLMRSKGDWAARPVDRQHMAAMQTPQAFEAALLRRAHERALRRRVLATDEVSLVRQLGQPVRLVWNDEPNLKITTPADLAIARALVG